MNVLLIDDDVDLAATLSDYLAREGFDIAAVNDGVLGLVHALSGNFSIVVLDMVMAGLGGLDNLKRIRSASEVPVVLLSGRREQAERIRGLELGADACVSTPCTPRELAARIRAILRRTDAPAPSAPLTCGALAMWPERRDVSMPSEARKGAIVSLCERGPSVLTSTPRAPARCERSDCAEDDGW